jgi:hypothetical protein
MAKIATQQIFSTKIANNKPVRPSDNCSFKSIDALKAHFTPHSLKELFSQFNLKNQELSAR